MGDELGRLFNRTKEQRQLRKARATKEESKAKRDEMTEEGEKHRLHPNQ